MSRSWREHYHGFLQAQEIGQAKALEFGQLPNFIGEFKKWDLSPLSQKLNTKTRLKECKLQDATGLLI
jgi:hypothetical protein